MRPWRRWWREPGVRVSGGNEHPTYALGALSCLAVLLMIRRAVSWPAQRGDVCAECPAPIRRGQQIRWVGEGYGVRHDVCPPPPAICPDCHVERAANGSCGCD